MPTPNPFARGQEYFLVTKDQLTQLVLDLLPTLSPEIRQDTGRMADLIREMVELEREKRGLDKAGGKGTLALNSHRDKSPNAPDYTGELRVSGKSYRVSVYVAKTQEFINLTFSAI